MKKANCKRLKLPNATLDVPQYTRRNLIKSAAGAVSAAILPGKFASFEFPPPSTPTTSSGSFAQSQSLAKDPRWYGFNLLEYFSTDPDWMKYFPYRDDGMFPEDDFRWIRDWGFNWVRLTYGLPFLDRAGPIHDRRKEN